MRKEVRMIITPINDIARTGIVKSHATLANDFLDNPSSPQFNQCKMHLRELFLSSQSGVDLLHKVERLFVLEEENKSLTRLLEDCSDISR